MACGPNYLSPFVQRGRVFSRVARRTGLGSGQLSPRRTFFSLFASWLIIYLLLSIATDQMRALFSLFTT